MVSTVSSLLETTWQQPSVATTKEESPRAAMPRSPTIHKELVARVGTQLTATSVLSKEATDRSLAARQHPGSKQHEDADLPQEEHLGHSSSVRSKRGNPRLCADIGHLHAAVLEPAGQEPA